MLPAKDADKTICFSTGIGGPNATATKTSSKMLTIARIGINVEFVKVLDLMDSCSVTTQSDLVGLQPICLV